jgi:hypothetical protein
LGSVGEPGKGQGRKRSVCEKRWKIKYSGQSVNGPLKSANSLARINPKALTHWALGLPEVRGLVGSFFSFFSFLVLKLWPN